MRTLEEEGSSMSFIIYTEGRNDGPVVTPYGNLPLPSLGHGLSRFSSVIFREKLKEKSPANTENSSLCTQKREQMVLLLDLLDYWMNIIIGFYYWINRNAVNFTGNLLMRLQK